MQYRNEGKRKLCFQLGPALAAVCALAGSPQIHAVGGLWTSSGQSLQNERHQKTESKISNHNVDEMVVKWETPLSDVGGGDVWTTPAVDGEFVYFPDSNGFLFKLDRETGNIIWQRNITEYTGKLGNFSRTTPAIAGDLLILGDQGNRFPFFNNGVGALVFAVNKHTGDLVWSTEVDNHLFSIITQSATVFGNTVFVGVSSYESAYSIYVGSFLPPDYQPTARGSLVALEADTGAIKWKTYTIPENGPGKDYEGFSGGSVWGSAPSIDVKRGQVFVGTGQNFSMPDDVKDCAIAAYDANPNDPDAAKEAARSCFDDYPDNLFDSIIAMDIKTGEINWARRVLGYDVWHAACIIPGLEFLCPTPTGTDADFAQAPIFYTSGKGRNKLDLVGVGQKSGIYWAFDAVTGETVWSTRVSPGGIVGGLQWGSAYDGDYIYTSSANSNRVVHTLPDGSTTTAGIWSALDPNTGEIVWQTANPADPYIDSDGNVYSPMAGGAVSVANGVVYACSLDPAGMMYALDGADGVVLWSFASGGSCNSGAAIVNGTVYWGSGYASPFDPTWTSAEDFQFRAFSLPGN